jgi:hypothetical protein
MTGKITILLGGVSTPLYFGMMAVEEFSRRQAKQGTIASDLKSIYDLVYAGYYNSRDFRELDMDKTYGDIAELVDDLVSENDQAVADIYKCFTESRFMVKVLENVKKKEPEAENPKKPTGKKSKLLPLES